MKFFIVSCFLVILGTSLAELEKRSALKRVVRSTFGQLNNGFTEQMKTLIIANCVENGFVGIEDDLRQTFADFDVCSAKMKLYVDTKENYLKNIEECSVEPTKKIKSCLTKKQSYFPDYLLNMVRKQVELGYDDRDIIITDLTPCMKIFENADVASSYLTCLSDTAKRTNDTARIPDTVEIMCSRALPAVKCMTDILDKECTPYPLVKKYIQDNLKANEYPCQQKYD
ncbi:uncharacterized protein LOC126879687 [Diabrotica virgifera virgifera]|uniref:Uncharacterized protein LOC114342220 isoform X1 n=2 Tax=Diabrotica virgifera virgifera TaxID=50390 RepID=A0A6P7GGE8_DIAVI|nr:uncharacterized protein LOC126879687 [Diabrotica virgifera virgifera]